MHTNRRTFLRTAALSGVGVSVFSSQAFSWVENRPIRLAYLTDAEYSDGHTLDRLLQRDDVDALVVDVAPVHRPAIALAAMKAGKCSAFTGPVGQTVGTIQQLWNTHRQTGTPCVLLEQDFTNGNVLAVSSMLRENLFGELTHVQCGTASPTNGLLPAMEWLGINQTNRFLRLNASLSRSWGLHEAMVSEKGFKNEMSVMQYELGEVLTINLQCANGQSVTVLCDKLGKRPYARGYRVQGTKGYWIEENDVFSLEGRERAFSAVRHRFHNLPVPGAEASLIADLQNGPIPSLKTQHALTVSLIYTIAKASLNSWGDDVELPNWFV